MYEQRMDRVRHVWMKGIGLVDGSITTELVMYNYTNMVS